MTYYSSAENCILYRSCELADEDCDDCLTSAKFCQPEKDQGDICSASYECRGESFAFYSEPVTEAECRDVSMPLEM